MDHFVCLQDYEDHALKVLSKTAVGFYRGGADQEQTSQMLFKGMNES